jgi:hypothetical protein
VIGIVLGSGKVLNGSNVDGGSKSSSADNVF